MNRTLALLLVAACAAACDSRAKANDPPPAKPEQKSKEYESCGASLHCEDNLRCFDQTCRRTARSTVGDYFAAVGNAARVKGDSEAAIAAYDQALGHYESEKVSLPPDVDCAYGAALAGGRATRDHAELGAKVLHRCVLAVPVGSALRDRALADLASLSDSGLSPLALGGTKLADTYLKLAAAQPPSTDKTVKVEATPAVTAHGFEAYPAKVTSPELHNALVGCAEAYTAATKKDTMVVAVGIQAVYYQSQFDDEPGGFAFKLDPAVAAAGADAAAEACVRGVVEPALKMVPIPGGFATKLMITIK